MFLATILRPNSAGAESSRALSWSDCVAEAEAKNSSLKAAENAFQVSRLAVTSAESGFYPSLSASLGVSQSGEKQSDGEFSAKPGDGRNVSFSAQLTLSQNLFNGFADWGRVKKTKAELRAAEATFKKAKEGIILDLKKAFSQLVLAQDSATLNHDIVRRREENLKLVELRFEGGRENKGSLLLSKAYYQQSLLDEVQAKNAVLVARANLAKVLGRDESDPIEVTGEAPTKEPSDSSPNFWSLVREIPDHLEAAAQEEALQGQVLVKRSDFLPTLSAFGSVGKTGSEFFPQTEGWSAGLSLNWPLFNGFKHSSDTRAAILNQASQVASRQNLDRELVANLERNHSAFREAVMKLKVDEAFRSAAKVRSEIARGKYNNGLLSFEDWDIIESDLINRQKTYLQSKRDRVVAEAEWRAALDGGVYR